MCGRFTLRHPECIVPQRFNLGGMPKLPASYNIAPGGPIAVIRHVSTGREIVPLTWGLLPHWTDDPSIRFINARAETASVKRPFKYAYRYRRCLVPADGFYEWQSSDGKKQPYFIRLKSDEPFAFGAIWERWWKGSEVIESCAILTTSANKLIEPVCERMPVIIRPEDYGLWLHPEMRDVRRIRKLMGSWPGRSMRLDSVSTHVNNPRHDDPSCCEPAEPLIEESLLFH